MKDDGINRMAERYRSEIDSLKQELSEALSCWEIQVRVIHDDRSKWKQCAEGLSNEHGTGLVENCPRCKALDHFNQLKEHRQ